MELSGSNIKEILISSQKKALLIFSQKKALLNGTLHFPAQVRKIKNNLTGEKFLYFRKRKPPKTFLKFLTF